MNFPPNNSINIEALMLALSQQDESLPEDIERSIDRLKDAAFMKGDVEASEQIREVIRQSPELDASYKAADQYLDSQHNAQHRTKALAATFPNPDRLSWVFYDQILPSHDWVNATQHFIAQKNTQDTDQPEWIRRGNSIVTMISGGAFLGVMLAQIPGAIVGAIVAGIFGWITSKPKTEQGWD
jgi:hypothetical protein